MIKPAWHYNHRVSSHEQQWSVKLFCSKVYCLIQRLVFPLVYVDDNPKSANLSRQYT